MKTVFLKKMIPVAVFAMGIAGAFVTTSMQSTPKTVALEYGYLPDANNHCASDVEITCNTIPKQVCLQNITSGPQVFAEDAQGNCSKVTYRP
jgi:hypothetical protein